MLYLEKAGGWKDAGFKKEFKQLKEAASIKFGTVMKDTTVVTWGKNDVRGVSSKVMTAVIEVDQIYSTKFDRLRRCWRAEV